MTGLWPLTLLACHGGIGDDTAPPECEAVGAEVPGDGIDQDCDASDAGPVVSSGFRVRGERAYGQAGFSVEIGADVTGDGEPDLLVGAPDEMEPGDMPSIEGRTYVVEMPLVADASLDQAVAVFPSDGGYDTAGRVSPITTDLTGDGQADLLWSAYTNSQDSPDGGAAWLFEGPVSGSVTRDRATAHWVGDVSDALGAALASADFDGDGLDEVVIGALRFNRDVLTPGRVYLYSSPLSGELTPADAEAVLDGVYDGDYAGVTVAVGDLDGDGRMDIASGAPKADVGGAVYASYAPLGGAWDAVWLGVSEAGNTGKDTTIGDVDGDGRADLVVGAHLASDLYERGGAAYVVTDVGTGTHSLEEATASIAAERSYEWVGNALAVADLNLDGVGDLVVSAPRDYYSTSGVYPGKAYVFFGPVEGTRPSVSADRVLAGNEADSWTGGSLTVGDVDGDTRPDLVLGAPNTARDDYAGEALVFRGVDIARE